MQARSDARFSTYSGAPSLQPSLASTVDIASSQSSCSDPHSSPSSQRRFLERHLCHQTGDMYTNVDAAKTGSSWTLSSTDSRVAEIRSFALVLDKMADARLDNQRYVMSGNKTEEFSKIALGAKLDRALSRRMVGQDAVFRTVKKPQPSVIDEKRALEVQAA